MNRRLAPVVAGMLSLAGCGDHATPGSPSTTSMSSPVGSWSGSINDPLSADGTMHLALNEQTPNSLTGTWSAKFKNGDNFSGLSVASLFAPSGYGITLYVDPPPPCARPGASAPLGFTLINVSVTSGRLTAVGGRISCSGTTFGITVNLSKQ